jgi:hypothetical protein
MTTPVVISRSGLLVAPRQPPIGGHEGSLCYRPLIAMRE